MSVEAYSRAWASRVGDPYRKLVLLAYADYAHRNGRNSCPSKPTVAEYAECDKRTVQRHTDALLAAGFIRRGDQSIVEHIRADRRPVVYDIAMDDQTRLAWQVAAERGDIATPRPDEDLEDPDPERGDTESPRPRSALSPRDDTHGVTDPGPRGDTAVSPNPSTNPLPPSPPAADAAAAVEGRCARHGDAQSPNCRGCGTTQRQRDEAAAAAASARKRADDRAALAEERARRAEAARALQSATTRAVVAEARQKIRSVSGSR